MSDLKQQQAPGSTRLVVMATLVLVVLSLLVGWSYSRQEDYRTRQILAVSEARGQLDELREKLAEARRRTGVDVSALSKLAQSLQQTVDDMSQDDPVLSLVPSPLEEGISRLSDDVEALVERIEQIRKAGGSRQAFAGQINLLVTAIPRLQQASGDVVEAMVDVKGRGEQIAAAQRQVWIAEKMRLEAVLLRQDAQRSDTYMDSLQTAVKQYEFVLEGMWAGEPTNKIRRVSDPDTRRKLSVNRDVFLEMKQIVQQLGQMHEKLQDALVAGQEAAGLARDVGSSLTELKSGVLSMGGRGGFRSWHGLALFAVALLFVAVSLRRLLRVSADSVPSAALNALSARLLESAGSGSSVSVTSEDLRLQPLVIGFNAQLERQQRSQEALQQKGAQLADRARAVLDSVQRAEQLRGACVAHVKPLQEAVDDMKALLQREQAVAGQAGETVEVAHTGWEVVQKLNSALDGVADTLQEARNRLQRSDTAAADAKEATDRVAAIAGRTRLLAMNATILANAAGEAGRGFSAIADDIQGLADRVTEVVDVIAKLIGGLRADAAEASGLLDDGGKVLTGAVRLGRDAGKSMVQLEKSGSGLISSAPVVIADPVVLQSAAVGWQTDSAELQRSLEAVVEATGILREEAVKLTVTAEASAAQSPADAEGDPQANAEASEQHRG